MSDKERPETLAVEGIDHVTLIVKNLERSRLFYCDLLGMTEVTRPDFPFSGLWFQAGKTQIHLILEHDESSTSGDSGERSKAKHGGRTHHFAFVVADASAAVDVLKERGVPIRGGPSRRPDGPTQVWCSDPDGHVVEVFSWPT